LKIKLPRCAEADGDLLFLTAEEIERLTTSPQIPEPARIHFELTILVGWRQGEASGLRWEDVEMARCEGSTYSRAPPSYSSDGGS
jgi:integrase